MTAPYEAAAAAAAAAAEEEDYAGKWRPMSLKVKLGRSSDEPEVEESRMVYMKQEEKRSKFQLPPPEHEEEELPPGNHRHKPHRMTSH